ncbi:hypothetical protein ENBRE01_2913 [Enteropsectra breve]|nr:hypothetical protein ENBRE01_2913 [Enteropsectra breve]
MFICQNKICKRRFNPWEDTIFYQSKLSKKEILLILELWTQKTPINIISYVLKLNRKAIYRILFKLSAILDPRYYETLDNDFGGDECVDETDESKFGKRKYNKGHHVEGVWVLGMIERSARKRIKLFVLDNRTRETLVQIIG